MWCRQAGPAWARLSTLGHVSTSNQVLATAPGCTSTAGAIAYSHRQYTSAYDRGQP